MGFVHLFPLSCAITYSHGKSQLSLESARGIMRLKNFLHLHTHRLKVEPLATLEVGKEMECTASCLKGKECFSFNVKKITENSFLCELLNTSKYINTENLTQDESFTHWYLQDPCLPSPCTAGKCVPHSKKVFTCKHCPVFMGGRKCDECEDPNHNFALGKPATQSSIYKRAGLLHLADLAVDGNTATDAVSEQGKPQCTLTRMNSQHWWSVHFEAKAPVARVDITNRIDYGYRLSDIEIMIGDSLVDNGLENPKCGDKHTIGQGLTESIMCSPILFGRYLTITVYHDYMNICEVAVYCK